MIISGNRADEELFITLFALQSILILEGVDSMPAYKDPTTGTWFVKFYSKDWKGENRQVKKRGFKTKKEALEFERNFKMKEECNLDMTFGEFFKLYTEDMQNRLKRNTWLTKEHIVRTKILPYFQDQRMNEITASDVMKWQNELIAMKDNNGEGLSPTYRKTIHNQLSCIFNHACRYYQLKSNPEDRQDAWGKRKSRRCFSGRRKSINGFLRLLWISRNPFMHLKCCIGQEQDWVRC